MKSKTMAKHQERRKQILAILRKPYQWVLIPDPKGGFSSRILEFPGCFSEGNTGPEAVRNLRNAAANWLAAALDQELPIPEPALQHQYQSSDSELTVVVSRRMRPK